MIRQICAFLRKDLLIETSYKISFLLGAASTLTGMAVFYFIDKLFGRAITPYLAGYGTGYFAYVFTATAFFGYIGTGAGSYAERLRAEQLQGTLEASLAAPVRPAVFLTARRHSCSRERTLSSKLYFGCQPVSFPNLEVSGIWSVTSEGLNRAGSGFEIILHLACFFSRSRNSPTVITVVPPIL